MMIRRSTFSGDVVTLSAGILMVTVLGAGFYGWVMNIIKMVELADQVVTGMFILRLIGILIAPLGAILGYI